MPRYVCDTNGRGTPVDRSQMSVVSHAGTGTPWRLSDDDEDLTVARSGSLSCALAISSKSIPLNCWSALTSMRDSASATGLSTPLTCRMSPVNCKMKSRCRICRGECCVEREVRARVSGLWSVNTQNSRPSTMWRNGEWKGSWVGARGRMYCNEIRQV